MYEQSVGQCNHWLFGIKTQLLTSYYFITYQGCTTYLTFSARNISESQLGAWVLCPEWGPGAKRVVRRSGGRSPPEADDVFLIQLQIFCIHSHVYAEMHQ